MNERLNLYLEDKGVSMRILIACESSGIVREECRRLGHDAVSCDLLPSEIPGPHIQGDVRPLLREYWDLIIAHPPCTFLCSSGLHHNVRNPERQIKTDQALEFVQEILDANSPRIGVENPVGRIGTAIRPADQYIQPYEFGHDASKRTGLWLKGLPLLRPTGPYVAPRWVCCNETLPDGVGKYGCPYCLGNHKPKPRWGNQTNSGQNRLGPSADRWQLRSETYQGIARAMAEQWTIGGNDPASTTGAASDG